MTESDFFKNLSTELANYNSTVVIPAISTALINYVENPTKLGAANSLINFISNLSKNNSLSDEIVTLVVNYISGLFMSQTTTTTNITATTTKNITA